MNEQTAASVDAGNLFIQGSQGRWAGEQLMAALASGNGQLNPQVLRTNGVLRKDEWVLYDTELIEGAVARTQATADLIGAGLTKPIPNSMGKTVLMYDRFGDLADATVSMDGMVRTENDRPGFAQGQLPIPITHKDWFIPLRTLAASRNGSEALDTTMTRLVGRKIAEKQEHMLLEGSKQFAGMPIYGYLTHPDRLQGPFTDGKPWEDPTKTGEAVLLDVQTMIGALQAQKQYGPFWIYTSPQAGIRLDSDFKATGTATTRQRIASVEGVSSIKALDFLPVGSVLAVQAQRETVVLMQGEPLQTVQWDINGGFGIEFKGFLIAVPLIRAQPGQSGIYHMSNPVTNDDDARRREQADKDKAAQEAKDKAAREQAAKDAAAKK
jgi:uncharacterized linocin/CFP29 family protein